VVIGTGSVLSFEGEREREGGYNKSGDGINSLRDSFVSRLSFVLKGV